MQAAHKPRTGWRLTAASKPASDRRRHRRVPVLVTGRLLDGFEREAACETVNVSAGGAVLDSEQRPPIGASAVLYLEHFGRLDAEVVRHEGGSLFGVRFQAGAAKRERIVETLTWLIGGRPAGVADERRHPRQTGAAKVNVRLESGRQIACEIEDFSLVGMALRAPQPRPMLGEWVRVGDIYGRVARYTPVGFAVDFENRRLADAP